MIINELKIKIREKNKIMFTTKGVETGNKVLVSKYIQPGIHDAAISAMEVIEGPNSKGVKIHFVRGEGDVEQVSEAVRWMGEGDNGLTKVLKDFAQIANCLGKREQLDAIEASNEDEYIQKVFGVIGNQMLRFKFSGTTVEGKEGKNNWVKSDLAFYNFVESLDVPVADSKLKFDPNNAYDIKPLKVKEAKPAEEATKW